ncbi:ptps-like type 4 [hydrocarbon metagenome]|uniref:Ptps-like type 4 n=1 Tax=hydrocarbon metagenome TaxID=938273 RepID=A0A0W8FP45_9ZZZZ
MFRIAVRRDFVAHHFLIGGDWGSENKLHSHHYIMELELAGTSLNQHGYLIDIVDIEDHLDNQINRYREQTLNELDEFSGLNPSLEQFCRILCNRLSDNIHAQEVRKITLRLWEDKVNWASYEMER